MLHQVMQWDTQIHVPRVTQCTNGEFVFKHTHTSRQTETGIHTQGAERNGSEKTAPFPPPKRTQRIKGQVYFEVQFQAPSTRRTFLSHPPLPPAPSPPGLAFRAKEPTSALQGCTFSIELKMLSSSRHSIRISISQHQ